MADSIERIALEMQAHRVFGSRIAELDDWATRLRALSPAGGAHSELLEAILLEHADGLAAAAASLKAALAAAPKPQDAAATSGECQHERSHGAPWRCAKCGHRFDDATQPAAAAEITQPSPSGQTPTGAELTIAKYLDELATDPDPLDELDRRYIAEAAATIRRTATSAGTTGDDSEDAARLDWLAHHGASLRQDDPPAGGWFVLAPYHTDIPSVDGRVRYKTFREAIDAARRAREVGK